MTVTTTIFRVGTVVVWPECSDNMNFQFEHAILLTPYETSVDIEQYGRTITIPRYALRDVIRTLRAMEKEAQ